MFLVPDLHVPYVGTGILFLGCHWRISFAEWRLLRHFICITQAFTNFWIFLLQSVIWSVSACCPILPTLGCYIWTYV